MDFVAGAGLVPLDQERANVVANLLEPRAPDSLLAWGFFDAIFEQKEGVDARVAERLAREMLAKDPNLQHEFDAGHGAARRRVSGRAPGRRRAGGGKTRPVTIWPGRPRTA